jgi:hypothetical protein
VRLLRMLTGDISLYECWSGKQAGIVNSVILTIEASAPRPKAGFIPSQQICAAQQGASCPAKGQTGAKVFAPVKLHKDALGRSGKKRKFAGEARCRTRQATGMLSQRFRLLVSQ